jgi:hypothetical protein
MLIISGAAPIGFTGAPDAEVAPLRTISGYHVGARPCASSGPLLALKLCKQSGKSWIFRNNVSRASEMTPPVARICHRVNAAAGSVGGSGKMLSFNIRFKACAFAGHCLAKDLNGS